MSFVSPLFLWFFMPVTLAAYWLSPRRWRNGLVAVASLVFYTWGTGAYTALLLSAIVVNYTAGIAVDSSRLRERPGARRSVLLAAVMWDLGILVVWKYAGFAAQQIDALSSALGLGHTPIVSLALPIGISFFTFHHLSYVVDVYRHSRPAQKSLVQFVTYIAMFPQLVAGPIVRYREISEQLADTGRDRLRDFTSGFPASLWAWPRRSSSRTRSHRSRTRRSRRPVATSAWRPPGWAPWPTPSRSTSTSPVTRTWPSVSA